MVLIIARFFSSLFDGSNHKVTSFLAMDLWVLLLWWESLRRANVVSFETLSGILGLAVLNSFGQVGLRVSL